MLSKQAISLCLSMKETVNTGEKSLCLLTVLSWRDIDEVRRTESITYELSSSDWGSSLLVLYQQCDGDKASAGRLAVVLAVA